MAKITESRAHAPFLISLIRDIKHKNLTNTYVLMVRLSVFVKTQYVIEMTLGSALFEPVRDTYSVKDVHGNLLGYAKKRTELSIIKRQRKSAFS
jgi:hypothetical protein